MIASPRARPGGSTHRRLAVATLRIGVATGILAYLFRRVPIERLLETLRGASICWVAAAFAGTMILQWFVAARLRRLIHMQGLSLSTFEAFEINLAARFYALFVPGGNIAGVGVRIHRFAQSTNSYVGAGIAVAADRIAATITLCFVGILFWLIERPDQGHIWIGALGVVLFGIAAPTLLVYSRRPMPLIGRSAIPRFAKLHDALSRYRSIGPEDFTGVFSLSIAAHLGGIGCFWMLSQSLDFETGLLSMGWIRSCILLPAILPFTVGGLGLREGASVLLLGMLGISEDRALAFGLLIFAVTALGVGVLGGMLEGWRWTTGWGKCERRR